MNLPIYGGTEIYKCRCHKVSVEMALVTKMSMWSRQIQHSRFGGVCLSGTASEDKLGYPNTFKCTLSGMGTLTAQLCRTKKSRM